MKKILFALVLLTLMFGASAQTATTLSLAAGDTLTDAGTSAKTIKITGGYSGVAVQVTLTKLSGTGAGSVVIQGSNDGSKYTTIGSAYTITNTSSQSTMFYVTAPVPVYLKILATGSGTESVVQTVSFVARKYQN